MRGVLLDPRTGRPQDGQQLGVWTNPASDMERELHRAPAHVKANLARSAELGGAFEPRGSGNTWEESIYSTVVDGTAITNTTTETIMVPDFTIPGGYMTTGKVLKYLLWGRVSTVVTTPGTITFRLRWGGVAGVAVIASKAQRPKTTVSTNMAGWLEMFVICRSSGVTGTMLGMGQCQLSNTIGDAQAATEQAWPDAPATATTDTTIDKLLSPTIQFSVATATTSWTTHWARVESLN
jgi:hypothetical protein